MGKEVTDKMRSKLLLPGAVQLGALVLFGFIAYPTVLRWYSWVIWKLHGVGVEGLLR